RKGGEREDRRSPTEVVGDLIPGPGQRHHEWYYQDPGKGQIIGDRYVSLLQRRQPAAMLGGLQPGMTRRLRVACVHLPGASRSLDRLPMPPPLLRRPRP